MEDNPIYSFDLTRKALEKLGMHVGDATGFISIGGEDVLPEHIQNISFTSDGIQYDFGDGRSTRVFLYKRRYRLQLYGKPRYHIRNCETIQGFMASGAFRREYRMANTDEVKVINWDNGDKEETVSALPLCRFCLNMALTEARENMDAVDFHYYKDALDGADSSAYSEMLRDGEEEQKEVWVDINGYTDDWPGISFAYRQKHDFTCERCGVKMKSMLDYRFMQTHHRNGVKTNNNENNLECLCIDCHSKVDANHIANFSKGANKVMLDSFRKKYKS